MADKTLPYDIKTITNIADTLGWKSAESDFHGKKHNYIRFTDPVTKAYVEFKPLNGGYELVCTNGMGAATFVNDLPE